MKTLSSVLISFTVIVVIAYAVTFTGCSNSVTSTGTVPERHQARTEAEFADDTNLVADPRAVVLVHLEHLPAPIDPTHHDTDSLGIDIIPYRFTETAVHTYRIGDSSHFKITLINKATRTIVFQLNPVNNFIRDTIPAGDYLIVLRSLMEFTGDSVRHQNVFIQPDRDSALSRGGGTKQVDYDPYDTGTLFHTNSCPYCDLSDLVYHYATLNGSIFFNTNFSRADFSHANLTGAALSGANLTDANFSYTNLTTAGLSGANLYGTNLSHAILVNSLSPYFSYTNLSGANLSNSFLGGTNFSGSNLDSANLSNSILSNAQFFQANLSYANLSNAKLTSANLSFAGLGYANLSNANLSNANLSYANLYGANLSNADLSNANVKNANFCSTIKTGWIITHAVSNSQTQCWP
ncbi:MAG: pentapeptide repeat-containing protein [Bacteroidetes bacterium]|nr:pentapeptide repeat-containing protein [Bacteroidota bacterium]